MDPIEEQSSQGPTQEQVEEMRTRMMEYYSSQLPFLRAQSEFEELLANIEKNRVIRVEMTLRLAHLTAPPEEPVAKPEEPKEESKRKLKTDA